MSNGFGGFDFRFDFISCTFAGSSAVTPTSGFGASSLLFAPAAVAMQSAAPPVRTIALGFSTEVEPASMFFETGHHPDPHAWLFPKVEQVIRTRGANRFQGVLIAEPEAIHLRVGVEDYGHVELSEIVEAAGNGVGDALRQCRGDDNETTAGARDQLNESLVGGDSEGTGGVYYGGSSLHAPSSTAALSKRILSMWVRVIGSLTDRSRAIAHGPVIL